MMLLEIEGYSSLSRRASGHFWVILPVSSAAFWVAGFRLKPSAHGSRPLADID